MADIQLEFRTTELNGVLLSVSERKGSPSLSLAIDDGTVNKMDRTNIFGLLFNQNIFILFSFWPFFVSLDCFRSRHG